MLIGLLRHGESEGNVKGELSSNANDVLHLTATGKEQIELLRHDTFFKETTHCIYVSPFCRTLESAATLVATSKEFANMPFVVDPRVEEEDYGKYDRLRIKDIKANLDETFRRIATGDYLIRLGYTGENRREFLLRVYGFLVSTLQRHQEDERILVITHSSVILAIEMLWIRLHNPSHKRQSTKNGQLKALSFNKSDIKDLENEIHQLLFASEFQANKFYKYNSGKLLTFMPAVESPQPANDALIYSLHKKKFYVADQEKMPKENTWFSGHLEVRHATPQTIYSVFAYRGDLPDGSREEWLNGLDFIANYIHKYIPVIDEEETLSA